MLGSLRTYRLARAFVAAVLLFSVSLPLVRYACAMTGTSIAASATSKAPMCPESEDSAMPVGPVCSTDASNLGVAACCHEEIVPAVQAPLPASEPDGAHFALPLVAVLTDVEAAPDRSVAPHLKHLPTAADGGGVPIRVLHASFLL